MFERLYLLLAYIKSIRCLDICDIGFPHGLLKGLLLKVLTYILHILEPSDCVSMTRVSMHNSQLVLLCLEGCACYYAVRDKVNRNKVSSVLYIKMNVS